MSEIKTSNYVVYKIELSDGSVYIGSTKNFVHRRADHLSNCYNIKSPSFNFPIYNHIRDNKLVFNRDCFEVLEHLENVTLVERLNREMLFINKFDLQGNLVLNAQGAGTKIGKTNREYYLSKRGDILKEDKESKTTCECGGTYTKSHKARHFKSKKHQTFLETGIVVKLKDVPRYTCVCGSNLRVRDKNTHKKTKKHLDYLAKNQK